MQRARRLASTIVVAVLAGGGLSACRAEPDVAAYIGKRTITEARVDAIYADAERKLTAAVEKVRAEQAPPGSAADPQPVKLQIKRRDVLEALLGADVLGGIAQRRGVQSPQVDPARLAQSVGLPPEAEYVAIFGRYQAALSALATAAPPAEPRPGDLRQVYDRLVAAGNFADQPMTFEQFSTTLSQENQQRLSQVFGLRDQVAGEVAGLNLTVNPKYGISELPLFPTSTPSGGTVSLLGLPLDKDSGGPVVVDQP